MDMDDFSITRGLRFPFYPMNPMKGRRLNRKAVPQILHEVEQHVWVLQPVLGGTRAILGTHNGKVLLYDSLKRPFAGTVNNLKAYLKLGDGCCLDGEVYQGGFYPFECLAFQKRSLMFTTTDERSVMAYSLCRFVHEPWMFKQPTERFMAKLAKNGPKWTGVILKKDRTSYVAATSAEDVCLDWIVRPWASGSNGHVKRRLQQAARECSGLPVDHGGAQS